MSFSMATRVFVASRKAVESNEPSAPTQLVYGTYLNLDYAQN